MEELLLARLKAAAAVTAIAGDRGAWGKLDQQTAYPYYRLSIIDDPRDYHLQGDSKFRRARVQVDIQALSYTEAKALSDAICADLSGAHWGAIQGVFILDARDQNAPDHPDEPHHKTIDLRVAYTAA